MTYPQQKMLPFAKHCLFLHCRETHEASRQSASRLISGFVLALGAEWVFITAGHCLKAIEAKKKQQVIYSEWGFVTAFAQARSPLVWTPPNELIHFNFDALYKEGFFRKTHNNGSDSEIDLGFILLKHQQKHLLHNKGIEPVKEEDCRVSPQEFIERAFVQHDRYEIYGIPEDQHNNSGPHGPTANLLAIGIEPLQPSAKDWKTHQSMFHARFDPRAIQHGPPGFGDFAGLSGGPIVGTSQNGLDRYVVAVQSGWHKPTSTITACLLAPFVEYLKGRICEIH